MKARSILLLKVVCLMFKMQALRFPAGCLLAVLAAACLGTFGADFAWNPNGSGGWGDSTRWQGGGTPGTGDTVSFSGCTGVVTAADAAYLSGISEVTFANGGVLEFSNEAGESDLSCGAKFTGDGSVADSLIAASDVSDAVDKRHAHSNKDTLDNITAAYTAEEQAKLSGIDEGAQVNTIESISVSGTAVTPDANKNVNIVIPKAVPDPTAPNQMLFSVDGANWAPVTWEMELFDAVRVGDKIYDTVKIGDQVWLAENLDFLPEGITLHNESPATADFSTAGAWYCNNDKSTAQSRGYGLLYNTMAVDYLEANKATLFPGWHVPTEADMNALVGDGTSARRNSMRKAVDWAGSSWDNGAATNSTGFSAIPCGYITNGTPPYYNAEGAGMEMWSCTVNGAGNRYYVPIGGAWTFYVNTHGNSAYFCGSVRLVKDSV